MPDQGRAPDQAARERITHDLDATLFVQAGAGSGKTSALVDRVLALVTSGVELRHIAAITFTEKAGAELRDRIRQTLEKAVERDRDAVAEAGAGNPYSDALDQLDGAAIGTLHSFAQRLLSEHPVEAGLPPRVEVLDEVSSAVAFERRWSRFRDDMLADPALQRTLLLLLASGVKHEALRSLAVAFDENWDLVEERVPESEPDPPSFEESFRSALGAVKAVCSEPCLNPADKLRLRLDEIETTIAKLEAIDDELDLLEALRPDSTEKLPSFKVGNIGKPASFPCDLRELRDRVRIAGEQLLGVRDEVSQACARRLGSAIRRFTLGAAVERQREGQLEFHDLLVLVRALLRDPLHGPVVRARLQSRYQRLLLDEFQDTDPIQIELAVRIAAADPTSYSAGTAPWGELAVEPGHLFVVGDPKQSIYRFRRADISTYLTAHRRFGVEAGGAVELTANFRSVSPIIEWVNATFSRLMSEPDEVEMPVQSQPGFVALVATRPAPIRRPGRGGARARRAPSGGEGGRPSVRRGERGGRHGHPGDRRALGRRRRQRRMATGATGGHHRPRAGAHVVAIPRGRVRPGWYSVSGRVELARVRQPGSARSPHGAPRRRRPDQLPPCSHCPADAIARLW